MVRRRFHIILVAGALLALLSGDAHPFSSFPDFEIIHESTRTLSFTYRPAGVEWTLLDGVSGSFSRLAIARTSITQNPGEPQLPVRVIYFALPPGGDFEFSIIEQQRHTKPGVRLPLYSPPLTVFPDGAKATPPGDEEPVDARFPEWSVQRLPVGWLRSQRIGGLAIYPVTYYPAENRAEVLESITIQVRFVGEDKERGRLVPEGRFDRILSRLLLNSKSSPLMRRRTPQPGALGRPAVTDPFEQAHTWHKLRTGADGIYRITYELADTLGINPAGIADPRQIRIFSGGGVALVPAGTDTLPAFREIAIYTEGFADGSWDPGDYLEFYGMDLHRWDINPATNDFVNVLHPFEEYNVYWLTPVAELAPQPRRVSERDGSLSEQTATQIFAVPAWSHHEKNLVLRVRPDRHVGDYYRWYWQQGKNISISPYNAIDIAAGQPATVHLRTYSFGNPASLIVNGDVLEPVITNQNADSMVFELASFDIGTELQVDFANDNPGYMYLDLYDIEYQRELRLRGGRLKFAAPEMTGTVVFSISNIAGAEPVLWDITDPFGPIVITNAVLDGGVARFQADLVEGERAVYWVSESGWANRPVSAERRKPSPLFTSDKQTDFLAIGPRHLVEAAEDYLLKQEGRTGLKARIISVEDVYDNFSGGLVDPLAIQWFLKYAFANWPAPAPQYALLVGDGHFDLADNQGNGAASYMPPYLAPDEPFPADESFVYFGGDKLLYSGSPGEDPYPDMIIGRWPVKSTAQVRAIAEKINRYMSSATLGPWRNRVGLIADDEATGHCVYDPGNEVHTTSAEYISESIIPVGVEQRKIYLTEYPFGSSCRSKPAARQAILDLINDGVALIDYIGHGNPDLWAHEHVLERANDVPKMQNKDRLTVMYTASCSNGFFDDPTNEGLAEEVLRWPDGGAVAVISATRLVFANANMALNTLVFELLYGGDVSSLGEALYLAKLQRQFETDVTCSNPPCERPNDRRFNLFGDPTMPFGAPRHRIVIDEVQPDTLPALGVVTVTGHIVDINDVTVTDFSGEAEFLVSDAFRERRYQINANASINYKLPGGTIYHGTTPVSGGAFSFGFIVPKDITYGDSTAKITGYAVSGNLDAGGGIGGLHLGGTAPGVIDTTGPVLELRAGEQLLTEGMVLASGSLVTLVIGDTSGVNLTGEPGHAITVTFDDDRASITDITKTFTYDAGDYRHGNARFTLPTGRGEGPINITVKAWDNANNSAQLSVVVSIGAEMEFRILELLNYPNPFERQTAFYFRTNGVSARAVIEVFTVSGKLIKTIANVVDGETAWDGTDDLGQKVANGVYLAKLTVEGSIVESGTFQADNTISEKIQKVVVWR